MSSNEEVKPDNASEVLSSSPRQQEGSQTSEQPVGAFPSNRTQQGNNNGPTHRDGEKKPRRMGPRTVQKPGAVAVSSHSADQNEIESPRPPPRVQHSNHEGNSTRPNQNKNDAAKPHASPTKKKKNDHEEDEKIKKQIGRTHYQSSFTNSINDKSNDNSDSRQPPTSPTKTTKKNDHEDDDQIKKRIGRTHYQSTFANSSTKNDDARQPPTSPTKTTKKNDHDDDDKLKKQIGRTHYQTQFANSTTKSNSVNSDGTPQTPTFLTKRNNHHDDDNHGKVKKRIGRSQYQAVRPGATAINEDANQEQNDQHRSPGGNDSQKEKRASNKKTNESFKSRPDYHGTDKSTNANNTKQMTATTASPRVNRRYYNNKTKDKPIAPDSPKKRHQMQQDRVVAKAPSLQHSTADFLPGTNDENQSINNSCDEDSMREMDENERDANHSEDGMSYDQSESGSCTADPESSRYSENENFMTTDAVTTVLAAELVTADALNEEDERERIRKMAEADAEARLLASAVTAEATVYVEDEDDENEARFKWKLYGIVAFLVVAIIVVLVVVLVVVANRSKVKSKKLNDVCELAIGPLNVTGDIIAGNNKRATFDNVTCEVVNDGGYGLWYYLEGTGQRLRASTCDGTEFDTQLLIFAGECDNLACIGGNDQGSVAGCRSESSVAWFAEQNIEYYILVRGFRPSNVGSFTLTIEPIEDNSNCGDAFLIEDSTDVIFGSTRDLMASSDTPEFQCGGITIGNSSEAWYRFDGDGGIRCASVFSEKPTLELSILLGSSCDDLECASGIENTGEEASWIAEEGSSYFLVVQAPKESSTVKDFFLSLRIPPENDQCETSLRLDVNSKSTVSGTTIDACGENPVGCEEEKFSSTFSSTPGVWYVVSGTGDFLTASTCNTTSDYIPQILVYTSSSSNNNRSSCNNLQCVEMTEELCGDQSSVTWFSEEDTNYFLLIQAFNSGSGDFNLTVDSAVIVVSN